MRRIPLLLVLFASLSFTTAATAQAERKSLEELVKQIKRDQSLVSTGLWEDPDSGCRYFLIFIPGSFGMMSSIGIATIRYRADGKPDCRDAK